MIEQLPIWIEILFLVAFIITLCLFYYANNKPKRLTFILLIWSVFQSILAWKGFYLNTSAIPPRFGLALVPTTILIIYSFNKKTKKWVLENRNIQMSTFLHTVRILVELVLFGLFINKMIPELMTFEGRNYDIIIGISAPIIGLLVLKNKLNNSMLLIWNIIGLCFVLFILINGILSSELPFQQFGFEQPNRAISYFPFILLPAVIVPIVIWTHISDIIFLINKNKR